MSESNPKRWSADAWSRPAAGSRDEVSRRRLESALRSQPVKIALRFGPAVLVVDRPTYPSVGVADARTAALGAKNQVHAGIDPIAARKAAESERAELAGQTFKLVAGAEHRQLALPEVWVIVVVALENMVFLL